MIASGVGTTILDGARLLMRHGGVAEARILETGRGTISGYFESPETLADAVARWNGRGGIYMTVNPVVPDLLGRACNRVKEFAKLTTTDKQIVRRVWFLTDFDPVREAGISATDTEVAGALARRDEAVAFVRELGFPDPVTAMSGNGGHAIWPVDLPNDEATLTLFRRCLAALNAKFGDGVVTVDEAVVNAARIWKLYGSIAAKGDAIAHRPHRRAQLDAVPDALVALDHEPLEALAAMAPPARAVVVSAPSGRGPVRALAPLDLVGAFQARGWYLRELHGGKHGVTCPWADEHSGVSSVTETCLFDPQAPGMPWGFKCLHAHCTARTIRDVLGVLGLGGTPNNHHHHHGVWGGLEDDAAAAMAHNVLAEADRRTFTAAGSNSAGSCRAVAPPLWPTLAPEALYGLAGQVVETIDPHTEADRVATLATFLVCVGNLLGPGIRAQAGEDPHPGRLYATLAGQSSKGRKGSSWRGVLRILAAVDETWARSSVASGMSSGEGLIHHVRDARDEQQAVKERGRTTGYETVTVDHGVEDKRLCVEEPELGAVLRRIDRESNSLSAVLRQAWDDGNLRTLTKQSPLRATGAHISVIAHITQAELVSTLAATERVNGFANRFLYFLVQRSKELPSPRPIPDSALAPLTAYLRDVVEWAQAPVLIERDPAATAMWEAIYPTLSAERPGLVGSITARAEAHVLRLSVVYAALDRSTKIRPEHLAAALAVWSHAETSARLIFGAMLGDPIADAIDRALAANGVMTRTQIRDPSALAKNARGVLGRSDPPPGESDRGGLIAEAGSR